MIWLALAFVLIGTILYSFAFEGDNVPMAYVGGLLVGMGLMTAFGILL